MQGAQGASCLGPLLRSLASLSTRCLRSWGSHRALRLTLSPTFVAHWFTQGRGEALSYLSREGRGSLSKENSAIRTVGARNRPHAETISAPRCLAIKNAKCDGPRGLLGYPRSSVVPSSRVP